MARQSPNRPDADEPSQELAETGRELTESEATDDPTDPATGIDPDDDPGAGGATEDDEDRSLWEDVRIEPVEIALPSGSGFTLRAYRLSTELAPTDIGDRDADDPFAARARQAAAEDDESVIILDEEFNKQLDSDESDDSRKKRSDRAEDGEHDAEDDEESDTAALEEEEEAEPEAEDVPIFLSHRGKLLIFKSPESLVSFVRSGAPHDLTQLDTWDQLVDRIRPADIAPLDEDSYELDLVVENLRGGHDVWDATLLIEAGEAARDLAYALRLTAILDMLSSGSSLDNLDEALRATVKGGIGGFIGRRRLRKIGAQTASLGWRTIIGKISAVVDWRD